MICEGCGKTLEGRQSRFCSDKCRMQVKRTESQAEQRQSEQTESEQVAVVRAGPTVHERQCAANNETRREPHTINTGPWRPADQLAKREHNRVSLPGDSDYDGIAEPAACAT